MYNFISKAWFLSLILSLFHQKTLYSFPLLKLKNPLQYKRFFSQKLPNNIPSTYQEINKLFFPSLEIFSFSQENIIPGDYEIFDKSQVKIFPGGISQWQFVTGEKLRIDQNKNWRFESSLFTIFYQHKKNQLIWRLPNRQELIRELSGNKKNYVYKIKNDWPSQFHARNVFRSRHLKTESLPPYFEIFYSPSWKTSVDYLKSHPNLTQSYLKLIKELTGRRLSHQIPVVMFDKLNELQNFILDQTTQTKIPRSNTSIGSYSNILLCCQNYSFNQAKKIFEFTSLFHELTHSIIQRYAMSFKTSRQRGHFPSWFSEGLAIWLSLQVSPHYLKINKMKANQSYSHKASLSFKNFVTKSSLKYALSPWFLDYLIRKYSKIKIKSLLEEHFQKGMTFDMAFKNTYKMNPEDLFQQFISEYPLLP